MRIIGGSARSRTLAAPKGQQTRPTQDMVREALFNMLQGRVAGARVLDLFAGSGALGLESLSRGAQSAVFVDASRSAAAAISANVHNLGFEDRAELRLMDWQRAVKLFAHKEQRFTLVFLDPPYRMPLAPVLEALLERALLEADAVVVLEHGKEASIRVPPGFALLRSRTYRDTALTLLCLEGDEGVASNTLPGQF